MKILITRPRAQADSFAAGLIAAGFEPYFFPVIEIRPIPGRSYESAGSEGKLLMKWSPLTLGVNPGTRTEVATGTDTRATGAAPPPPDAPAGTVGPAGPIASVSVEPGGFGVDATFVARYAPWPIPERTRSVVSMSGRAGSAEPFVAASVRATASTVATM